MVVLRPGRSGLVLHTMYYSSEVRAVDEFRTDTTRVGDQELELATMLVRALAARFEPSKYRDHYQENLRALLEAKIQGKEIEDRAGKPALAPVVDILEALKASLARKKEPQLPDLPYRRVRRRRAQVGVGAR
jgi:DNA end-binding protein Ku